MLGTVGAHLAAHVATKVAALPAAAKAPDANGLATWLQDNALKVVLTVIGIGVIVAANRAQLSKVIKVGMVVVVGMFIIFGGGAMKGVAEWAAGFFS